MLIVFTGHRDRTTDPALLYALEAEYPYAVWMHGGADGFDTQVHNVAIELGKQELPAFTRHLRHHVPCCTMKTPPRTTPIAQEDNDETT